MEKLEFLEAQTDNVNAMVEYFSTLPGDVAIPVLCTLIDTICTEVYGLDAEESKRFRHSIINLMDEAENVFLG